jgi:membrane protease YdiL (CAAX protease family)
MVLFIAALAAAGLAVEGALRLSGSAYSLTDSRGPGQIGVFFIVLPGVLLFTRIATRVDVWQFFARYATEWRRTLKGLLTMFGATLLACIVSYLLLGAVGSVLISTASWQEFRVDIASKVVVALLIALVLATAEELVFRGFLLRYLRPDDRLRTTVGAVVVSSAVFSVSHLLALATVWEYVAVAPMLIGLFAIGLLLGTTYVVTGSLACSIGVHWGLVGFKVILIKSFILRHVPEGLMAGRIDIRLTPVAWLAFLLATLAIILLRRRLHEAFAVETAACPDDGGEFRRTSLPAVDAAKAGASS